MKDFQRIGEILDRVNALAAAQDWVTLDEWVRTYDYAFGDKLLIVALLRSSFPMREKLRYYRDAVERARLFMPRDELRGLY